MSLCKIAALCEERENVAEIADLSEQIRALHESQQRKENNANQDNDDMITEWSFLKLFSINFYIFLIIFDYWKYFCSHELTQFVFVSRVLLNKNETDDEHKWLFCS